MLSLNPIRSHPGRATAGIAAALLVPLACAAALRTRGPAATASDSPHQDVLRLNQSAIARLEGELARDPANPRLAVSLAQTRLARVGLVALLAYERQPPQPDRDTHPNEEYIDWRKGYLKTDPDHVVTNTVRTVRDALQRHPPARERSELLSVLATALCCLGRHREEAAVLRHAVRLWPEPRTLAGRLARAHAEAGQFRQAEAILSGLDATAVP